MHTLHLKLQWTSSVLYQTAMFPYLSQELVPKFNHKRFNRVFVKRCIIVSECLYYVNIPATFQISAMECFLSLVAISFKT